jgi:adenylate cyclase
MLKRLQEEDPDCMLYQLYYERIELFRENPPEEGWDGTFTHQTK